MMANPWARVTVALVAAAFASELLAIWMYDWRWGATGGVTAVTAWLALLGAITTDRR